MFVSARSSKVSLLHLCRTRSTRTQQCTRTLHVCPQPSSGLLLWCRQAVSQGGFLPTSFRSALGACDLVLIMNTNGRETSADTTHGPLSEEAVSDSLEDLPVDEHDGLVCIFKLVIHNADRWKLGSDSSSHPEACNAVAQFLLCV